MQNITKAQTHHKKQKRRKRKVKNKREKGAIRRGKDGHHKKRGAIQGKPRPTNKTSRQRKNPKRKRE